MGWQQSAGIYERSGENGTYHAGAGLRDPVSAAAGAGCPGTHAGTGESYRICGNVSLTAVGRRALGGPAAQKQCSRFSHHACIGTVWVSSLFTGLRIIPIRIAAAIILCSPSGRKWESKEIICNGICLCWRVWLKFLAGAGRICRIGNLGGMGSGRIAPKKSQHEADDSLAASVSGISGRERYAAWRTSGQRSRNCLP